jgi:Ca2+-binding EF-hand superfamily protein
MKPTLVVSTLAATLTLGTLAFAHGGGGGRMFERLDANKDGKVTTAEATTLWKQKFAELDKNKDNVLSAEEIKAGKGRRLKHADANHDGKVTLAEAQAKATEMFQRFDKNEDNVLTRDEMPAGRGKGHGRGNCSGA